MKTKACLFSILISIGLLFITACDKEEEEEVFSQAVACFSYSSEVDEFGAPYLAFTNCSQHATSYLWDFGDSTTSIAKNPIHYYTYEGVFVINLTAYNESNYDIATDTVLINMPLVRKPNIYLYPDQNMDICINLEFPQGGQIITSIPEYHTGWCVYVDTSGKIDNQYDCLFYESMQPDVWQYDEGWCVKKESLKEFFETNMKDYNFSEKEIKDFTDYWIPRLNEYEYYVIYPQNNDRIDQVIQLNFSIEPDHIHRLFYGIIGSSEYQKISEPVIYKFNRNNFTVVEWGVFLK